MNILKKQPPARVIAAGFILVIFIGSLLLMLPISHRDGVSLTYIDSLYTATSAVCVTGLVVVDTGDTFSVFGQAVIATLIQIGGLGVTAIGAGVIMAMGKHIGLRGRRLIQESMNIGSPQALVRFLKSIFFMALMFELIGALLSFTVFIKIYPPLKAIWISIFHSIAAFNNAGFDIAGNFQNMIAFADRPFLIIVTAFLIIFGGIGFWVIKDLKNQRFRFKKLSLQSKVVITMSLALIIIGTVLLKISEDISWLGAFFTSVTTRTAGFTIYPLNEFSNAGLFLMMILMVIGASSGSTGGGIKTGTLFVLILGVRDSAANRRSKAFKYSIHKSAFQKAAVITVLAFSLAFFSTFLISLLEPQLGMRDVLFEMFSAMGTAGLSTGITPTLGSVSKIVSMCVMFTGRLGPLTIASLWHFGDEERVRYPYGDIAIG